VRASGEYPADFRRAVQGWLKVTLEIGESELADEIAGSLLLNGPIAEA
jgi:hypothetical protein